MIVETLTTFEAFQAKVNTGSVLLHLDVDWAMQAMQSRKSIGRLADRILSHPRLSSVRICRVDCSAQEGELWSYLLQWSEVNFRGNYVYGGCGALVWLRDGQVRESAEYAARLSVDELFAKTMTAFAVE